MSPTDLPWWFFWEEFGMAPTSPWHVIGCTSYCDTQINWVSEIMKMHLTNWFCKTICSMPWSSNSQNPSHLPLNTEIPSSILSYFIQFARYTANMPEIFKQVRAMGSTCEASAFRKVRRAHMKYELTTICKIPYLRKGGYKWKWESPSNIPSNRC